MGDAVNCITQSSQIDFADWISIAGIVVNAGLAFWIVITIQKKVSDKRILKDHFINEIKDIRNEFRMCLNTLYNGQFLVREVLPWFKLMNIKINDLMSLIGQKHKCVRNDLLVTYQVDLPTLVTESQDFISQFEKGDKLVLSESIKNELIMFQQKNNNLFNNLIIKINDN